MLNKIKIKIYNFLRGTEKYTGTDNVYIAQSGGWLTLGNIISAAASFILSIAFARLLPKETYGEYRYIISVMSLFAISSLKGLDDALIQSAARNFEGSFKKILNVKLKWSFWGSAASIIWGFYFINAGQTNLGLSFFVVATFLPWMLTGNTYLSYLQGKKLFGVNVKYDVLTQILATSVIASSLFFTKNLIVITFVFFASHTIFRNYFSLKTLKKYPPNQNEDPKTISYGKHLTLISIVTLVSNEFDRIILFSYLGPVQLAIYSFALTPIKQIRNLLRNVRMLAYPKLAARNEEEIKRTFPKKLLKFSLFIAAGAGIYILIAPYLFKIFFPRYMESVNYSRLLTLMLMSSPASMLTLVLASKMKKRELYYINTFESISLIALLFILTPFYGIIGVIGARIISAGFHLLLAWIMFKKL